MIQADSIYSKERLQEGQIIPFNKPADWTSFDVVNKLRRVTGIRKIGHAGTLDPFATGVLILCFGKATKRVEHLMVLEKEYRGVIQLGAETDSHDVTGKVIQETPLTLPLNEDEVESALEQFRGEIQQVPPMFSALKQNGQKLYHLARKGKSIKREPRSVYIKELKMLALQRDLIEIDVVCSKGTYIRALARDIGRALGYGGFLKELVRTRIGFYTIENAFDLSNYEREFKAQAA